MAVQSRARASRWLGPALAVPVLMPQASPDMSDGGAGREAAGEDDADAAGASGVRAVRARVYA